MPANIIEINGVLKYTLGDSFTEPLLKFLEVNCYENMPKEGEEKKDTIFAEFLLAWAKAHYGEDFQVDTCIVKWNIEPGVNTITWAHKPRSAEEYGDLMRVFEPPVDEETYDRIIEADIVEKENEI